MAQIRLKSHECVRGYLPLVCVQCGQFAEDSKDYHFSRVPIWMYLLFFVGVLISVVLAFQLHYAILVAIFFFAAGVYFVRQTVNVDLPVCRKHRRKLGMKTVLLTLLIPVIVLLIFAVIGVPYLLSRRGVEVSGFVICIFLAFILFIFLGTAVLINRGSVRSIAITPNGITLKGVHPYFADIVHELRDAKYDE